MKKTQSPWYDRVVKEEKKLNIKIGKLLLFLEDKSNEDKVDPLQWKLMEIQSSTMIAYLEVLQLRIETEDNWKQESEEVIDPNDRTKASKIRVIEVSSLKELEAEMKKLADLMNRRDRK